MPVSKTVVRPTVATPETLRPARVPTFSNEELVTPAPRESEDNTFVVLILKVLLEARSIFSDEVQESVASTQLNVLFPSPDSSVIPPPSEDASVRDPLARIIFLSSTVKVVEFMVVVSPST